MDYKEIIDKLVRELSYRVGIPNIENKEHQSIMSEILSEWGEYDVKQTIFEFLTEKDKEETFTAKNKESGETAVFKSKESRDNAIEAGTHEPIDKKDDDDTQTTQGSAVKPGSDFAKKNKERLDRVNKSKEDDKSDSSEVKPNDTKTDSSKSEQVDRIDGEVKTQGLNGEIKAPGDPAGGSTVNEICQGTVIKILQKNDNLTNEQIEKEICNQVGNSKLSKVHICPVPGNDKMKKNRKSIINAGKAKHRRNQQIIKEEGLNPDTTTVSHVWGAKQSLEGTVDDLCSQNIKTVNGLPADCNKDNLFVKDKEGNFKLDDNGQKIAKPVEFDENDNPTNYMQVILNGGAGENPTDTMCVIIDSSQTPPRCEIIHDSDKMTTKDIQGNSGPLKTIELAQKQFSKLYDNKEDIKNANEKAEETQKEIVEGRVKVKEIISGQSNKWISLTESPVKTENKSKMDFIIKMLKNGQKGDEPKGLSSSVGKYYKFLQKRYKKQIEEYKSKNPNATQEELEYEMLRVFSEEYDKMSKYSSYPPDEFSDLKKRSNPKYKGDDKILPGNEDYIPSDAKQPTGDMQTIVMRTMEREDEFNNGKRTEPILTSTTLKEEYDKQTTALNNLREGMNEIKPGSGDEFFVEQMVERFHFGVSVGENPGGIPSNRFNLVMGRNESNIKYQKQEDGSMKIFRRISGQNFEEIDENGKKIEGGKRAKTSELEEGDVATMGSPESINHCLGLDENSTKEELKANIKVDVIKAGNTNQAEAIIYNSKGDPIARQVIRSKTGPGGAIADTIQFESGFQTCLQLYSFRKSKQQ